MDIGNILQKKRQQKKCTQEFIAKKLGISRRQYDRIEKNKVSITLEKLFLLLEFYQVDVLDFFASNINIKNEIEISIDQLLQEVKQEIFISEQFISNYNELLDKIDNTFDELSEEFKIKLDLIDAFYTVKTTNDRQVIRTLYKKYNKNPIAQQSTEYLNLTIPILSYGELIELAEKRMHKKYLNMQGSEEDNLSVLLNILAAILEYNEHEKIEDELLEEIAFNFSQSIFIVKLVLYFRDKLLVLMTQNFDNSREKEIKRYVDLVMLLTDEFDLKGLRNKIMEEIQQ